MGFTTENKEGPASVKSAGAISGMRRNSGESCGAVNTNIVNHSNRVYTDGSDVTHNDSTCANNGSIYTIVNSGLYSCIANVMGTQVDGLHIMKNVTAANTFDAGNIIAVDSVGGNTYTAQAVFIGKLSAGDKVWVHFPTPSNGGGNDTYNSFEIQRLK